MSAAGEHAVILRFSCGCAWRDWNVGAALRLTRYESLRSASVHIGPFYVTVQVLREPPAAPPEASA